MKHLLAIMSTLTFVCLKGKNKNTIKSVGSSVKECFSNSGDIY